MSGNEIVGVVVATEAQEPEAKALLGFSVLRGYAEAKGGYIDVFVQGGGARKVSIHDLTSLRCSCCGKYLFRGKGDHQFGCMDSWAQILELRCSNCLNFDIASFGVGEGNELAQTVTDESALAETTVVTSISLSCPDPRFHVSSSTKIGGSIGLPKKAKEPAQGNGKPHLRRVKVTGEMKFRRGAQNQRGRVASFGRR